MIDKLTDKTPVLPRIEGDNLMKAKFYSLIESLNNSIKVITDYLILIPEKDLDIIRQKGFWSIRQHVIHLVYTQTILYDRILKIKNEENPIITPYFPEKDKIDETKYNSISEALDAFKDLRLKQLRLINQFTDQDIKKKAEHDEYKYYNIEIILNHILFHDYWHMYRIEQLWLTKEKYLVE